MAGEVKGQRRARRIALSPTEIDAYLGSQRTCRVATVGRDGSPHVSALWFVWNGGVLWLNSVVKSQRWANLQRSPRVSVLVDDGDDYGELRGVELLGTVEVVGDVPRSADPLEELREPERLFGAKYGGGPFRPDGRHAWLRLAPEKIVSWDFRKLADL